MPRFDPAPPRCANTEVHMAIEEFRAAIPAYEEKIAELAEDQVDLIHAAGTPPFMLLGYQGEREIIEKWEKSSRFRSSPQARIRSRR